MVGHHKCHFSRDWVPPISGWQVNQEVCLNWRTWEWTELGAKSQLGKPIPRSNWVCWASLTMDSISQVTVAMMLDGGMMVFGSEGVCQRKKKLARKSIGFDILWAGMISDGEIKSAKEQHPRDLMGIKVFHHLDVGQILVVGPDYKWMFCSLKSMSPFFQSEFDGQQLTVPNVVVVFHRG